MASRQRGRAPKKERTPNQLADLGIFNVPDFEMNDNGDDSDVDESALESELEAILSGKSASKPARPKKKVVPPLDIERMAAECMKDIDDDDDDSDILDPDLLKELEGLSSGSPTEEASEEPVLSPKQATSIVNVLEERLNLYNDAVAAAKALNDNSKVRRYGRAIKELERQLKCAKSGGSVNEEDIPPVVTIPKASAARAPTRPPPLPPAADHSSPVSPTNNIPTGNLIDISFEGERETTTPTSLENTDDQTTTPTSQQKTDEKTDECKSLMMRRDQYKVAALKAKRAGDKTTALKYMKIVKSFDAVIEAINNGEPVDWSTLPPPPPMEAVTTSGVSPPDNKVEHDETQKSSTMEAAALSAASGPEDPTLFDAPPPPSSILEALNQRLEKYTSTKAAAEAEGNSGKVRRLQRIIKSYEKAIKDHKMGKSVDFEELPTPPGFAPIPVGVSSQAKTAQEPTAREEVPAKVIKPDPPKRPAPQVPAPSTERQKPKVQRANTYTGDKQLEFLLERQKLFRQAAISAKANGDIQQAKEYLRMSKGFDSMIEAVKCGLPIDCSTIPTPPQLESDDFVVVDVSECIDDENCSSTELLETLESDLTQQIEVCTRNKEHFLRFGDVTSASKFEKLGLESKKDLCVIKHLQKTGQSAPKFHYETRIFSMVMCHTDLNDDDLEISSLRGINLPGKADELDSYLKLEFPIPSEAPQTGKTHTIRNTNNPEFPEVFKFKINRKSRAQLRQFKRHALKIEIWLKGGFLRSDTLIGTVNVKLLDLESKCKIHDSFDVMDGRKASGGKLEVKIRVRQPLHTKQVEEVREKWLVIGS